MLRSMQDLEDYTIGATDGDVGEVKDFYFDDETWVIRYFIVDTGAWLSSRKVLISPISILSHDWVFHRLNVAITKEQVKNSPDIDVDKPVSRQHEIQYLGYYGYPYYWGLAGMWSTGMYPGGFGLPIGQAQDEQTREERAKAERARHQDEDPHLRSCKAIIGYHIKAIDGEVGHVESLLIDEDTWAIQYLVVNTSNWWLGHKVLIAPEWIDAVRWLDKTVSVDLECESIKTSPLYASSEQLNRERESSLYNHYGRAGYWLIETEIENEK
ncbi:MAG: PRC-barrel domain-containing protein [Pseudomonas sp.]